MKFLGNSQTARFQKLLSGFAATPIVVAVALFFAAPASASGVELWNGATYGMSVEQVKKTTGAKPYAGSYTGEDGHSARLELRGITIAGRSFSALFYFDAARNQLAKVIISADDQRPCVDMKSDFDELMRLLRSRYGREMQLEEDENSIASSAEAQFQKDGKSVQLIVAAVAEGSASLALVYRSTGADGANKLRRSLPAHVRFWPSAVVSACC